MKLEAIATLATRKSAAASRHSPASMNTIAAVAVAPTITNAPSIRFLTAR
jgi:hypothetical protein